MEPIFELDIDLPPRGSRDLLGALHRQLRAAILEGRLHPGLRLPPTRTLAAQLGISRNTAVTAYDLLLSEGYLMARPGAGTFVAETLPRAVHAEPLDDRRPADRRLSAYWRDLPAKPSAEPACPVDFCTGVPDTGRFDFRTWRRLATRALFALSRTPACYADPAGSPTLREAIAGHVSLTRAVSCGADDFVVTAGAQQAFDLLARILVTPGQTVVAVEDPGYPPLRDAFAAAGAGIEPVPVDEEGLIVERIPAKAAVVCVTPSHQFPLGVAMSPQRRAALLDFAQRHEAVIVEDDYDGEFRFGGRPLDALQTLDRTGSVFYVGTFSKSLFPALRLGFVAAPYWARPALLRARQLSDWHTPLGTQETLAAFIAEGHLARHVRKMRRVYDERRQALLHTLASYCEGRLHPIDVSAGLHLAARLSSPRGSREVAARAAAAGIRLEPLERYALQGRPDGFVLGFGAVRRDQIEAAIPRLAAWLD